MQPFPGEDPPQDEVARLERPGADVAAVVSPQRLLVPCRPQCSFAAFFLPQYEVHPPRGVLLRFIKRQDPCGAMLDLVREDRFDSVDEEERGLTRWLGGGGVDGPQHRLELVVPAPATGLELLLEGPGLEAPQDLRVGTFVLTIAPGACHRSVANLRSKVSTVGFEEVTGELRAVVGDDAVGEHETAHEALDELDRGAGWDGADGFHFRPLCELVDGDVEVAVAP